MRYNVGILHNIRNGVVKHYRSEALFLGHHLSWYGFGFAQRCESRFFAFFAFEVTWEAEVVIWFSDGQFVSNTALPCEDLVRWFDFKKCWPMEVSENHLLLGFQQ